MKTKLNIELNKEELRLLSKQIKIEFANSNRQVTQLLDCKEKENKRRYQTGFPGPKFDSEYYSKISARLNKHMQDCCRLAIISRTFRCEKGVYQVDGQNYSVELFYEDQRNLINGMKNMDMGRLVIHIMRRAGIIDKETRDKMLSIPKEKGLLRKQKSKQKQKRSVLDAFQRFRDEIEHQMNAKDYCELLRLIDITPAIKKVFGEET